MLRVYNMSAGDDGLYVSRAIRPPVKLTFKQSTNICFISSMYVCFHIVDVRKELDRTS